MKHLLPKYKTKFDKKIDELFGIRFSKLDTSVINTLAYECPRQLLPILAKSFDVNVAELNEKEARELIFNAFEIHYYLGTFYSLNKALSTIFSNAELKEWFDYSGEPYHFKLELKASTKGIDKDTFLKTDKLVEKYKNVRSVFDGASIKIASKSNIYTASLLTSGEEIIINPFVLKNIETKANVISAATFKIDESIELKLNIQGVRG